MENCGILDPSNEVHMFALHHVFLPRINRNLVMFQKAYNRSPLSTERGCSPTQLWIRGMLAVAHSAQQVAQEFNNPEVQYCTLSAFLCITNQPSQGIVSTYVHLYSIQ